MNIKIEQIDLPKTIPCVLYSDAEGLDIYINSDLTAEDREFILQSALKEAELLNKGKKD